jgi:hypothetical protein
MAVRMDPALSAQLDAAAADDQPVQAVIALRRDAGPAAAGGQDVGALAEDLLSRVARETGTPPVDHNVFRNLGSFVVVAPPAFVRCLLEQPEVEAAMANRQPGPVVEPLGGRAKR